MVWLYLCESCKNGTHSNCELGHSAPEGVYGGSLCRCPCRGNPEWNTPTYREEELRKIVQSILDAQKASEEKCPEENPSEINCPPKKIKLKTIDTEN